MKISAITPKISLFESTLRKQPALNECYQAGRMLAELKMSEKEILDLFAKVEQGVTAAGNAPGGTSNRTLLGKAKDVPAAVMTSLAKFRDKISKNAYIQGVDQVFDRTTDALGKSALGKQAMPIIEKYRELSKQYPAAKSAITWGLIFLSGLASGGALAGPALIAGSKLLDGLLSGDKLSTATMNAGAAGAASAAIGAIPGAVNNATDWVKGHLPGGGVQTTGMNPPGTDWENSDLGPQGDTGGAPAPDDGSNGYPVKDEAGQLSNLRKNEYGELYSPTGDVTAPGGASYTVVKGDTISDLAQANNVSVKELADANGIDIKDVHKLATGQQLTIPPATGTPVYDQGWGTAAGPTAATPGAPASAVPLPGAAQQQNASRDFKDVGTRLMEAIVTTAVAIKPFKVKGIKLTEMIDRKATAHVWMLNEALGRKRKHVFHITEAGIDNIFKNVERYQRHVQIVVAESLLNELGDATPTPPAPKTKAEVTPPAPKPEAEVPAGPDRTNIPKELTPNMPGGSGTPQPEKPGMVRKAANWLGKAWAGAKNIGHQFTTKLTAEKLKMNWHVKGKPTDSAEIATFLQGEGVPANVISDVFTQSKLPAPAAPAAAAAAGAPATTPTSPEKSKVGQATSALLNTNNKAAMGIVPGPAPGGYDAMAKGVTTPATPATPATPTTEPSGKGAAATPAGPKPGQEMEMPGTTSKFKYSPNWIGADGKPAPEAVSTVLTQLATGTDKADLNTADLLRARRSLGMQENKKRYGRNLTSPARKAMRMFENFVEKTKVETKPLSESQARPLFQRIAREKVVQEPRKAKVKPQANEVIALWKKMPG